MPSSPAVAPLIVAGVPTNITLPVGSRGTHVDSDLHDIAARIAEIDSALRLVLLEHVDGRAVWAVTEVDRRGVESLVFRIGPGCEIDALDGRVIDKLQWIRRIPASERAAKIERELAAEAAAREEHSREKLYEDMGGSFYNNLFKCGFVTTPKPESLRPLNKTARRAGRRI